FMKFYFISGVGAGILSALIQPASTIPIIGASGAIYGILLGFAVMYPNRVIYLNFLIPIKVKYFVMIFAALELMASMGGASLQDGVAHFTHLSGMIFAYLYLFWTQYKQKNARINMIRFPGFKNRRSGTRDFTRKPPAELKPDEERELDELMDRIAMNGYDSLSEKEKIRLLELSAKNPKDKQ
ncbi:MAG: rhomboid family intramembrane serine protease, partial [FCB group bacterium]|nr:rhomboid family intramembrane serine protease [FCB group bacterium]